MVKNQIDFVTQKLEKDGSISRNECLKNYISRLAGIIYHLKKLGWDFTGKTVSENGGKNYYYYVTNRPTAQ